MSWLDDLRPASFRGVPFAVLTSDTRVGRRTAPHEYPFRDTAWVEDLGRAMRKFVVVGFLIGDDVAAQQAALIDAVETEGAAELVHPSMGLMKVACPDCGFTQRADLGRVIEVQFTFLEAGDRVFPALGLDLLGNLASMADLADSSAASDFARSTADALRRGAAVVQRAAATAASYAAQARTVINTATGAIGAVGGLLPGASQSFGRFASGLRGNLGGVALATNTVSAALARANQAGAAVTRAATTVVNLARAL